MEIVIVPMLQLLTGLIGLHVKALLQCLGFIKGSILVAFEVARVP